MHTLVRPSSGGALLYIDADSQALIFTQLDGASVKRKYQWLRFGFWLKS
jgi:hypothetical protein